MLVSIKDSHLGLPLLDMLTHGKQCYPEEACGIVYLHKGRYRYLPCVNHHPEPEEHFRLAEADFRNIPSNATPAFVFHTHPDTVSTPSTLDLTTQAAGELPWVIMAISIDTLDVVDISVIGLPEETPLFGRQFKHAVWDCYSFIRDYYFIHFGIRLNDYQREDDWWLKGENLYLENFQNEGFTAVPFSDAKPGDILLMNVGSDIPNHAAIFLDNGNIAHHITGRLSCEDFYGQYYRERTTHCLRHDSRNE